MFEWTFPFTIVDLASVDAAFLAAIFRPRKPEWFDIRVLLVWPLLSFSNTPPQISPLVPTESQRALVGLETF